MSHAVYGRRINIYFFCSFRGGWSEKRKKRKLFSLLLSMNFFHCVIYGAPSFIWARNRDAEKYFPVEFSFWFSNHERRHLTLLLRHRLQMHYYIDTVVWQLFGKTFSCIYEVINTMWKVKLIHLKCLNSTFRSIKAVQRIRFKLYFENWNKNS